MPFTPHSITHRPRGISRRGLVVASPAALFLGGCSIGADDDAEPTDEPTATTEPTQAPPAPTQPPIASPVPGYLDPERWKGRTLTVASTGTSDYLDALRAIFFDAFARDTGATVRHQTFGRDGLSALIKQVESGQIIWDAILLPMSDVLPFSNQDLLEAIDYTVIDKEFLYPDLCLQHGVGAMMYSTTMAYSVSSVSSPSTWKDFWDLRQFDGTRALRRSPVGTLEFALLADGVAIDDLFPLDIDRAFAKLETIRGATIFYEDSKQPVELVRTGQVGLASAWSARTVLPEVRSLVKLAWNQGMISADSWVVTKDGPNRDVAMSFINYSTRAVTTANFSRIQPFGPVNKNALALLRPDIVEQLPNAPENMKGQFFENWSYWNDVLEATTAQFEDWLLNPPATPQSATTP